MKPLLLLFSLPILITAAQTTRPSDDSGQTRLAVTIRGRPAGYATLSQHLEANGEKVVELRMRLESPSQKVQLHTEAHYDKSGNPTRKVQETNVPGGAFHKQVIATFGKDGAHVVLVDGEKRSVKTVTLAAAAPRASLSEFWFIRDQPKVGQTEKAYQFNADTLEWELVETVYKGKRKMKFEDREITAHEVVSHRGDQTTTAYLDDAGLPVLIEQGDIRMVKLWPKK